MDPHLWHLLTTTSRLLEIYKTVLLLQASKLKMAGKIELYVLLSQRLLSNSNENDLTSMKTCPRTTLKNSS